MAPPHEVPAVGRSRSTGPRVIVDSKNICALCRKQRQHGAGCPEGVAARKRSAKKRAAKLQKTVTKNIIVHRVRRTYETPAGCRPLLVRPGDTRVEGDARTEAPMLASGGDGGQCQVTPHDSPENEDVQSRSAETSPRAGASDECGDDTSTTQPRDAVESRLLDKEWLQRVATLPVLVNLTPCAKTPLDRRLWPTWKYTISDPALDPTLPTDPDASVFGGCDVYVWCPFTFFPHLIAVADLKCPVCGLGGVVAHGWCKGFWPIVSLDGRKTYLKYRRLRHPRCAGASDNAAEPHVPSGSGGRTAATRGTDATFSCLDERLLQTWYPSSVVALLPFRHSGDRIVTLDVVMYTHSMQQLADAECDVTPLARSNDIATNATIATDATITNVTVVDATVANNTVADVVSSSLVVHADELHEARVALASMGAERLAQNTFTDASTTNKAASATAAKWKRALAELTHEVNFRPTTKRKMRPCPECLCPNRAHRQRGTAACKLHTFYMANRHQFQNGPGGSGITAYDKAIDAYNKLRASSAASTAPV